jgi:hypothetical protein
LNSKLNSILATGWAKWNFMSYVMQRSR